QTIESLTNTNSVMNVIPVMRPLIAFDKLDIIKISQDIGTFETSILPYEDCCTVFLPDNPIIKPSIKNSIKQEQFLDIENLIQEAIDNIEIVKIKSKK
ncbi:MAG: tRNA 4-thiouridine(8) synthase ThiI, partial [Clostridia bacterium]|nr:tRNA 4-thiouridine(8) synthase ThiI [Clostridia bacterium]